MRADHDWWLDGNHGWPGSKPKIFKVKDLLILSTTSDSTCSLAVKQSHETLHVRILHEVVVREQGGLSVQLVFGQVCSKGIKMIGSPLF